jgi:hypothetical protein
MQSQNREVVTAVAVAIPPTFEKPAWLQNLPSSSFFVFFYISSGGEWQMMCFWSFKIWVHVFLFLTYTKLYTY